MKKMTAAQNDCKQLWFQCAEEEEEGEEEEEFES